MDKKARGDDTRRSILEAASASFVRSGYSAASIAEIAASAGVTSGALYFHFRSKGAIAEAIFDAQRRSIAAIQTAFQGSGLRPVVLLPLLAREQTERMRDDIVVRAGVRLAVEVGVFGAPIADMVGQWTDAVTGLAQLAIADGDLRADLDPRAFAEVMFGAFTGLQTVSGIVSDLTDLERRVTDLLGIMLPGVLAADRLELLPELIAVRP